MTNSGIKQLHVLVVGRPEGHEDLADWIGANAQVSYADTREEAIRALRDEAFDLVISRAADLRPLVGSPLGEVPAAVFNDAHQAVGIVGESGDLEWANVAMLGLPDEVTTRISRFCRETLEWAHRNVDAGFTPVPGRRLSFTTRDHAYYEITATPVVDLQNRVIQVAVAVWDTTSAKRLEAKIDAIDQAGRELLNLDAEQFARLDAQERLNLLEQKVLRCTKELLHFENFEIRVIDKKSNRLDLALASGMPASIAEVDLYASPEGNGICGYVAARGRSYICPDSENDPRCRPAIPNARSALTVPLIFQDQVVGVANFESTRVAAFNEDDRQFAEIFGRYVALALHVLELVDTERYATTGRLCSNVMAEITGPLNDILTDVESLVEDYIGHDDLRHRLRTISENAVRIRESIKEVTSTKPGLLGARTATSAARRDPVLAGKRVLIADDEDIIRETVHDVLIGYGCEVACATDGATAIDLIHQQPFDLVLSDIRMPQKNGYEVFAAAKDANPDTPVILTTGFGYDPNHSIVRARREGLAAVLFKPFKVDQLLSEIRLALTTTKP